MRNLILPVMQGVTLVHHHYQVRLLLCFGAFCIHYGPGKAVGLLSSCSLVLRPMGLCCVVTMGMSPAEWQHAERGWQSATRAAC